MVSIGTIASLATIAGVAIGAYALWRSRAAIGGAVTRGVESNIVDPVNTWFEGLWQSANPGTILQKQIVEPFQEGAQSLQSKDWNPFAGVTFSLPSVKSAYGQPEATQPTKPQNGRVPPTTPQQTTPGTAKPKPTVQGPKPFEPGYYYIDYPGRKFDAQWQIKTKEQFKSVKESVATGGGNVVRLGPTKLSQAGFDLFGRSKGYL